MKTITALLLVLLAAVPALAATGAWVLTTDYSTFGRLRALDGSAPWAVSGDLAEIPGDAVARHHEGLLYVVGRGDWNILQVRDPAAGCALLQEFSLGDGLNLQDIAFDAAGEAYVTCYDAPVLLRVDVAGEQVLGSYDTSAFADADGLPETAWMTRVGDRLYIACQLLDRPNFYAPSGPGALLVFDTVTEQWVDMDPALPGVQPLPLVGANPYSRLVVRDGRLSVGCAGYWALLDGGIETVDLATGQSLGLVVSEADLGGDVLNIQPRGDDWLAMISDPSFLTSIRAATPGGVTVLDQGSGYVHADMWLGGGRLFVADRTVGSAGIRVLDPFSGADLNGGTTGTGLPPFMFVLPTTSVSAVPAPAAPPGLAMGAPYPNPCNPAAEVLLTARPGARVRLDLFDLRGRRVRTAVTTADAAGQATYTFSGRDEGGRALAAGVYRLVARSGGGTATRSLTLIK